ncbi:Glycoside hydrolase family 5 [Macrophomina phaseolina MS6]|uniref:Endoglucanase EG-II n=1 Tax=Macrophomina phaseolina (strain MS6) TaxID=1126212 RepID=K2RE11_MACPH|nr:Glycoside hydrolase family 5 [Macrophomina phaseolina MS6]
MKTATLAAAASLFTSAALAAPTSTLKAAAASKVKFAGVNIAGFDFGCGTDGTCTQTASTATDPLTDSDGQGQMDHFVKDDKLNAFRLPVGWQYLVANKLGGDLDSANAGKYDNLVQGCLKSGAELCIIDIHNYARWNGQIIGQGGPTNDQFVSLWKQLATKYKDNTKVAFGVMNEPHDVPDINKWADTVQQVVTAIRNAGATTQYVLLPGNDWTSAAAFIDNGSAAALKKVTNPDGSTDNLIFDVHKYLDSDNSGTHTECVTNNIDDAFKPLADWLRQNKRMAINTESGGGNTDSCEKYFCEQIQYLNQNADVFLGYTAWSAGGFDQTYELVQTPIKQSDGTYKDTALAQKCTVGAWANA